MTGGTDTYGTLLLALTYTIHSRLTGAPETDAIRRGGGRGEALLKSVMQTIDIWSFGCVLSMAATWVVLGFQGIRDYEALRRKATSSLREKDETGPVANDAFHNGIKVLPEVLIWHDYLRENMRKPDVTTEHVLNLIEQHMLLEDPGTRIDSAMLCSKLAEIVEQSKEDVEARAGPRTNMFNSLLTDIDDYAADSEVTSQTLPSHDAVKIGYRNSLLVPAGSSRLSSRTGSPSAKQVNKSKRINAIPRLTTVRNTRRFGSPSQGIDGSLMSARRPLSMAAMSNPTLTVTEASDPSQQSLARNVEDESAEPLLNSRLPQSVPKPRASVERERVKPLPLDDNIHQPHGCERNDGSNADPVRPSLAPLQTLDTFREESTTSTPTNTNRTEDPYDLPSNGVVNAESPLESSEISTLVTTSSTAVSQLSDETRLQTPLSEPKRAVKEEPSGDHTSLPNHRRTASDYSIPRPHDPHRPYLDETLDIVQVRMHLDAKIGKTSHKVRDKLGLVKADPLLESYIENRDIAFVVDNGTTMEQHWSDVMFTLETLYLKLDGLDENGVDLMFTDRAKSIYNKKELKKSWGRTALVRSMNEAQPAAPKQHEERVRTNMREVLSPIFQKFLSSRQNKRMTLIVLTDGMWEGSYREEGVAEKIADFYKRWHNASRVVEDRWFSIQFVSFGKDKVALNRLQVLDDDMGAIYEIP